MNKTKIERVKPDFNEIPDLALEAKYNLDVYNLEEVKVQGFRVLYKQQIDNFLKFTSGNYFKNTFSKVANKKTQI